jgi:NADPH:quinone reductase-like Zn-dependent oxidoreductase/NAD(P)-dependent dehydrogenase (short-subunit alcohol dehydrogenase family)/acyl carrier protein
MARVIALEHPEWRCTCVDLDPVAAPTEIEALLAEIVADGPEDQIILRGGKRLVARLEPMAPARPLQIPTGPAYHLDVAAKGDLASLTLRSTERRPPRGHEVEIEVRAIGLNFRDVLNALGMYPGEAGPLGLECGGVIRAVGAGVTDLAVGDEVLAMAADSFAAFVTTDARLAVRKPPRLTFEDAATIPVVFLTSHYGLNHLARLKHGERVLIHAGAGGVGLSAIQLAQRVGAEVFATAGSPAKRAYLKSLGVHHVFDSRDLRFADEVRIVTGGAGVDVVLNSLAGAFIPASLALLAPGGRFLEIGKTDIWDAERVRQTRPDVSYFTIALDQMGLRDPGFVGGLLRELLPAFADGSLQPLPRHVFPLIQAPAAFRFMAQARHTGKIVLTPKAPAADRCRADGTYLITGGLGALGLRVARRLAERGAGQLLLVGRRSPSPEAAAVLADLQRLGTHVTVVRGDVAQEECQSVLAEALTRLPPLCGVVHAAGVLDDGILLDLSWERFATVLAPKAWGAWNLHRWTRGQALDFFVLFSSAAALLGSPGQANYAAANAVLDALAHHRHALGLPALSIAWGPWAGAGMAAGLDERERARWEARGLGMIAPETGLHLLGQLLSSEEAHVAVLPIDWARYLRPFGAAVPPMLSGFARTTAQPHRTDVLEQLRQGPPGRRREALLTFLRAEASRVLGLAPGHPLDDDRPLQELGLDSLLTVELRNVVGAALGRTLPATVLFNYPSIQALAGWLETELFGSAPSETAEHEEAQRRAEAEVGAMSEAELDDLLAGFAGKHLEGADQ